MSVDLTSPQIKKETRLHLERLNVFMSELFILKDVFNKRIEFITNKLLARQEIITKGIGIAPDVWIKNFSHERTDPILNVYFKSFFFVYRQATSSVLRIIFLMQEKLCENVTGFHLIDASKSKNFTKFITSLKTSKYVDYDSDLINFLNNSSDMLIIPRIIRNHIKQQGTIPVHVINNTEFRFYIFIPERVKTDDKSFRHINTLEDKNQANRLTVKPEFIILCAIFMGDLVKLIHQKVKI